MFVRFLHPSYSRYLYGKVVFKSDEIIRVEYLMDPGTGLFDLHEVNLADYSHFEEHKLQEKDLVYFQNDTGVWDFGFLETNPRNGKLYCIFSGERRELPEVSIISEPFKAKSNRYLQNYILSPRETLVARERFIRAFEKQRALVYGVDSTLSSLVNLENHQLYVAKRVLEDPLRRYVLADEVGLGKTIEAGFVVRQTLIDNSFKARICILCPTTLIAQWTKELSEKFQLNNFICHPKVIGKNLAVSQIEIVSHDILERPPLYSTHDLVIIDEAHRVMPRDKEGSKNPIFKNIQELTQNSGSVLMLSATPALHNEFGFLSMLSIIDPVSYNINEAEDFREKVAKRVEVAEIVAGLSPEYLFELDTIILRLRELFKNDTDLDELLTEFENYVIRITDPNDGKYINLLNNLKSYVCEAYKLNHRVIKNRRKSLRYITQNRDGVKYYQTTDRTGKFQQFNNLLETWIINNSNRDDITNYAEMYFELRQRLYNYYDGNFGKFGFLGGQSAYVGDTENFKQLLSFLKENTFFKERLICLKRLLEREFVENAKFIVFVSCKITADHIFRVLSQDFRTFRHSFADSDWNEFISLPFKSILVCDENAEEGLNIQGDKRYIIHFDLPLNVNRIEQRMGRVDRYGNGDPLKTFIILNQYDQFEIEWAKLLKTGIQIFDKSVASLQYLIEDEMSGEFFKEQIFRNRGEFLKEKKNEFKGSNGIISKALKQLDQEELLEEISDPVEEIFYDLKVLDDKNNKIQDECETWIRDHLGLSKVDKANSIFDYKYSPSKDKPSLISRQKLTDLKRYEALSTGNSNVVFTYDRKIGISTLGQKPSLLRYGNIFLNSIYEETLNLALGKSSLTWIYQPVLKKLFSEPVVILKTHFLTQADTRSIKNNTSDWVNTRLNLSSPIIQRRCDAVFPSKYETLSIASQEGVLNDPTCKVVTENIDMIENSHVFKDEGFKFDFDKKKLMKFKSFVPLSNTWFEDILELSKLSHGQLLKKHSLELDEILPSVQSKLSRRLNRYRAILDNETLKLEEELNKFIVSAIEKPVINLVASEALILSGDEDISRKLLG